MYSTFVLRLYHNCVFIIRCTTVLLYVDGCNNVEAGKSRDLPGILGCFKETLRDHVITSSWRLRLTTISLGRCTLDMNTIQSLQR